MHLFHKCNPFLLTITHEQFTTSSNLFVVCCSPPSHLGYQFFLGPASYFAERGKQALFRGHSDVPAGKQRARRAAQTPLFCWPSLPPNPWAKTLSEMTGQPLQLRQIPFFIQGNEAFAQL